MAVGRVALGLAHRQILASWVPSRYPGNSGVPGARQRRERSQKQRHWCQRSAGAVRARRGLPTGSHTPRPARIGRCAMDMQTHQPDLAVRFCGRSIKYAGQNTVSSCMWPTRRSASCAPFDDCDNRQQRKPPKYDMELSQSISRSQLTAKVPIGTVVRQVSAILRAERGAETVAPGAFPPAACRRTAIDSVDTATETS